MLHIRICHSVKFNHLLTNAFEQVSSVSTLNIRKYKMIKQNKNEHHKNPYKNTNNYGIDNVTNPTVENIN